MKSVSLSKTTVWLPIGAVLLFSLGLTLLTSIIAPQAVKAAYSDMSRSQPDDSYGLFLNGNKVGSSLECYDASKVGRCTAGPNPSSGGSHQYLTLSRGSINDDNRPKRFGYPGETITMEIFTKTLNAKSVSLSLVDRGIGNQRACKGYDITAVYLDGDNKPIVNTFGVPTKDKVSVNGCNKTYSLKSYPKAGFREIISNGVATGVYHGYLVFKLPYGTPNEKQASFHVNTSFNAKLGYKAAVDSISSAFSLDGWVNTYPTNAANGHKVIFRFSPPCETPAGTPFEVAWDDVNEGTGFQPSNAPLKIYRERRDGSDKKLLSSPNAGNEYGYKGLKTSNYGSGGGKPYVYRVEFSNIQGGNGISFFYPFPSANFFLDCPASQTTWRLNNATAVNPGIGNYNASGGSTQQKSNRAKTAYQQARFYHSIQNLPSSDTVASNGSHGSYIQYRLKRAASNTWRNSHNSNTGNAAWNKKSNNQSKTLSPSQQFLVNDGGSNPNVSIPRSDALAYLLDNCRPGSDCQNNSPPRAPSIGDTYCERVRTSPPTSNGGSTAYSQPVCIVLGSPGETCLTWQATAASTIRQVDGSNNPISVPLGNSISSAWAGQRYGYYYGFGKSGHATQTSTINFEHFSNGTNNQNYSQALGSWTPSYFTAVNRNHGGLTLSDQMTYSPLQGLANCTTTGSNTLSNTIYVPYYYHLTSITDGVGARSEQGDKIAPSFGVNLPIADNTGGDYSGEAASDHGSGRLHTRSAPTDWRLIEFKTNNENNAKAKIPKNKSGADGNCSELAGLGISGFRECRDNRFSDTTTFNDVTTDSTYNSRPLELDPVGTIICFVGALNRPVEDDDSFASSEAPAWRYSNVSCTTVVKSPKVQFTNGDVTVGRSRLTDGGSPCAAPNATAPIIATGAPAGVYSFNLARPNLYGSWVEYGGFATGSITGFGTAAYAQNASAPNDHKRLMFSNTPDSGKFQYSAQCLGNPFDMVKKPNINDISDDSSNLDLSKFFTTAPYNKSSADKTGYVATSKDINIVPPTDADTYTATVKIQAGAEGLNIGPDKACPNLKVTIRQGDGTAKSKNQPVCDEPSGDTLTTYTLNYNLGSLGYKSPQGLRVQFTNDYSGADGDRNVILGKINVEFNNNNSSRTIDPTKSPVSNRVYNPSASPGADGINCYQDSSSVKNGWLFLPQDQNTSTRGGQWCYAYELDAADLGLASLPTPDGELNDNFNAFRGRDIVLYAEKGPGSCGAAGTGGNIVVNTNIDYAKKGYNDISQLPRVILLADCKIIIDDNVSKVDAWLIAKDAVQTCSSATGSKFAARTVTQNDCTTQLTANGPVQAKRLLLWRTHGSDLTLSDKDEAAEIFDLRPDQLLATYARGRDAGKPETVYQTDLPPLY